MVERRNGFLRLHPTRQDEYEAGDEAVGGGSRQGIHRCALKLTGHVGVDNLRSATLLLLVDPSLLGESLLEELEGAVDGDALKLDDPFSLLRQCHGADQYHGQS